MAVHGQNLETNKDGLNKLGIIIKQEHLSADTHQHVQNEEAHTEERLRHK